MSDFFLFFIGVFVTLLITGAIGLLLWGAANEPRQGRQPAPVPVRVTTRRSRRSA